MTKANLPYSVTANHALLARFASEPLAQDFAVSFSNWKPDHLVEVTSAVAPVFGCIGQYRAGHATQDFLDTLKSKAKQEP